MPPDHRTAMRAHTHHDLDCQQLTHFLAAPSASPAVLDPALKEFTLDVFTRFRSQDTPKNTSAPNQLTGTDLQIAIAIAEVRHLVQVHGYVGIIPAFRGIRIGPTEVLGLALQTKNTLVVTDCDPQVSAFFVLTAGGVGAGILVLRQALITRDLGERNSRYGCRRQQDNKGSNVERAGRASSEVTMPRASKPPQGCEWAGEAAPSAGTIPTP